MPKQALHTLHLITCKASIGDYISSSICNKGCIVPLTHSFPHKTLQPKTNIPHEAACPFYPQANKVTFQCSARGPFSSHSKQNCSLYSPRAEDRTLPLNLKSGNKVRETKSYSPHTCPESAALPLKCPLAESRILSYAPVPAFLVKIKT